MARSSRTWTTTLERHVLADIGLGHDQLVHVEVVVVFGIGDGGLKTFLHVNRDPLFGEGQVRERTFHLLAANEASNEVQFLRRRLEHAQFCTCFIVGHAAGIFILTHGLFPLRFFVCGMTVVGPCWRIFTKLLTDHFLRDVDWDVLVTVVDTECQANKLRQNGRTTRPDLDNLIATAFAGRFGLFEDIRVNKRTFPY